MAWFNESNKGAKVKVIATAAQELGYTGIALSDHVAWPEVQRNLVWHNTGWHKSNF